VYPVRGAATAIHGRDILPLGLPVVVDAEPQCVDLAHEFVACLYGGVVLRLHGFVRGGGEHWVAESTAMNRLSQIAKDLEPSDEVLARLVAEANSRASMQR
jgi:hypothetical protein